MHINTLMNKKLSKSIAKLKTEKKVYVFCDETLRMSTAEAVSVRLSETAGNPFFISIYLLFCWIFLVVGLARHMKGKCFISE